MKGSQRYIYIIEFQIDVNRRLNLISELNVDVGPNFLKKKGSGKALVLK